MSSALYPVKARTSVLPWRPGYRRVFCGMSLQEYLFNVQDMDVREKRIIHGLNMCGTGTFPCSLTFLAYNF